ncbi:hypothetical protein ACFSC6_07250 [Rufibacter sediminis]|uniref:1,4-alpha-glucan branching enzyme n=1 Tax=Rufibacter sediminis TaxID=2762756 RepID=A0ABR6VY23_9BACT|nr:hypothetical protein [Rufibacter sediminis]MBC3542071.1 hypothetical protein [Rufibacter sediminis]
MAESAKTTTDHETIKKWAEARQGKPATVKGTGKGEEAGLLRINFPGYAEDNLEDISWEEFFEKFEEKKLAFLYQDEKDSHFSKLVNREK